jgi:peptidyl-prolyl cis-trans isomerase SurA
MNRTRAVFIIILAGLFWPLASICEIVDRVVAVVADEAITMRELERAYQKDALGLKSPNPLSPQSVEAKEFTRREYLEKMVEGMLVEQEVERQGINISALDIEKAIERQKKKLRVTDEQFLELLEREGITLEQYRKKVRQDLVTIQLIGKEVRSDVEISEDEMLTYYRQHPEQFIQQDQVHISILSVSGPEEITEAEEEKKMSMMNEYRQRAIQGEDLADLARESSRAGVPARGGDMGWFKTFELKAGFKRVVQNLDQGEVSQPFQLDQAWHILRVDEWKKGQMVQFEQAKDQIAELLYQEEVREKYNQWLERLKARSHVEIRL